MKKSVNTCQEIAVDKPQLLLKNQACFSLYSASNALIRAYRPLLMTLELTYLQYLTMMVVWEKDGINVKDISQELYLDSGTLTPLLKRLEAKGFITRERGSEDERIRLVFLTRQGHELKDRAAMIPEAIFCKSQLEISALEQLKETCEKLLENLQASQ